VAASARATIYCDGTLDVSFPFHRTLIDTLKAEIPAWYRGYDPATKTWSVEAAYVDEALDILLTFFPNAVIVDLNRQAPPPPPPPSPPPPSPRASALAVLYLLPGAPPELIAGAYRVLAKLCHPDRGGSNEAMKALNDAYARLEQAS
jgi:hypothetical protein